ncbi:hypothetical protein GCM10022226_68770 [Sphaerisporangium flaviroseum]|uniref:HTH luxR-type domain-containing protein n=1 Tax=Sphaerisporangium flaviroseum TaxID=509199 RepID=A0ABP7J8W0_9ACTN
MVIVARWVRPEVVRKAHVSRSLAKLGLVNRVQVAIMVHEAGLL